MSDVFSYAWAFVVGILLGVIYFGGLWLTVSRLSRVKRPGLVTLGSLVLRLSALMVGFYLIMGESHWLQLLVCLGGVLVSRKFMLWRSKTMTATTQ